MKKMDDKKNDYWIGIVVVCMVLLSIVSFLFTEGIGGVIMLIIAAVVLFAIGSI